MLLSKYPIAVPTCFIILLAIGAIALLLAACSATETPEGDSPLTGSQELKLPSLEAAELNGEQLRVVATTSIIGDVAAQIGQENIDLLTLMEPGQDPHSYNPGAQELANVAQADVILVNGWDLEESLIDDLENIAGDVPIVPVSAGITPLDFGGDGGAGDDPGHGDGGADPHVWLAVANVEQWARNVETIFSDLDPENAQNYAANAAAYLAELTSLEEYALGELAPIPEPARLLITNHDSLAYFAHAYGFEILGTVIPAASTVAEPSAGDLVTLLEVMQSSGVCVIFTDTTVSDELAQTIGADLDNCEAFRVVKLHTGALGPIGSGAESYLSMFRANVDQIVDALK